MTPERLAILKTMCERGHAKWREKHGDRPCDVLDINAELIAEVEALTADRDVPRPRRFTMPCKTKRKR